MMSGGWKSAWFCSLHVVQLCLEVGRVLGSVAYMCYNYVWRLEECLVL